MITIYIFLTITAIQLAVIFFKVNDIKRKIEIGKKVGYILEFSNELNKLEKFLFNLYKKGKGILPILTILVLLINATLSAIIHILYDTILHIITK